MKTPLLLSILICFISLPLFAQQNNRLRGKMLFLSSGKTPAVGVEISGTIEAYERANIVYTANNGTYRLVFPNARVGHLVNLKIGLKDASGKSIELVNNKEVNICRIPAKATDEFEIIVCRKGARDLAAQKYYNIIRTSSDRALAKKKRELNALLTQQEKNYQKIAEFSGRIVKLEKQTDSLTIYKEAFNIASINTDNASKRVLQYIQLLEEGKSIQVAREALSIKGAASDLDKSITLFQAAIEELKRRAGASLSIFDYKDAIICYDTIINKSEMLGIDPLKISEYYLEIAKVIYNDGKYKKALKYQQKGIAFQEEILDPKHPRLATLYNNIAITYRALGQYEKALEYQRKAIGITEETLGPEHYDLAISYGNAGGTYQALGQYEKALEYQQKSIEILEKTLSSKHFYLANSYNNIATTYQYLRQYEKALKYQQKAIGIREEILGSRHPDIAQSANNLGAIYQDLGQYEKALEYLLKAIDIREEILDPKHPKLAISYNNIALVYRDLNQHQKTLEYQLKAIDIREEILDPKHPKLGLSYWAIAMTYLEMKAFRKAVAFQEKCLAIFKITLPKDHPYQQNATKNMADIYNLKGIDAYKKKDYPKAISAYQKAVKILPEQKTKSFYNNIGTAYVKNKQFSEAQAAFTAYEKLFPNKSRPQRNWAMYYALKGEKEKALIHLQKAIELGFDDVEWLKTDDSMDELQKKKAFIDILEQLEKDKNE